MKGGEIEFLAGAGFPQAEVIDGRGVEAGDRDVVGDADELAGIRPFRDVVAAVVEHVFDLAEDLDLARVLGADDLPGCAELHPIVGVLDLMAVDKFLPEEAVFVVDAVADGGEVEGGEGVEETGGEAAQAAVAQAHVVFFVTDLVGVETELDEGFLDLVVDAGGVEAVAVEAPHEELEAEVVDALDVLFVQGGLGGDHPLDDEGLDGLGRGQPPIAGGGGLGVPREGVGELVADEGLHSLGGGVEAGLQWDVG